MWLQSIEHLAFGVASTPESTCTGHVLKPIVCNFLRSFLPSGWPKVQLRNTCHGVSERKRRYLKFVDISEQSSPSAGYRSVSRQFARIDLTRRQFVSWGTLSIHVSLKRRTPYQEFERVVTIPEIWDPRWLVRHQAVLAQPPGFACLDTSMTVYNYSIVDCISSKT